MKNIIQLAITFILSTALGQQQVVGDIEPILTSGLHKILVPHEIRSFAKTNLEDLRIIDTENNEIPYYIDNATTNDHKVDFISFDIIASSQIKDSSSTYVVLNNEKKIKQLVLRLANYNGGKYYDLLGSNDLDQWFGITYKQYLTTINSNTGTEVSKTIEFPLCSYKYLKLIFNDKKSLPINVLSIGKHHYSTNSIITANIPLSNFKISELKQEKKTKIEFNFEYPKTLNAVKLDIEKPEFYRRSAVLYALETVKLNHKFVEQKRIIKRFTLNSNTTNTVSFSDATAKKFIIEVNNQDNPKLKISKIYARQNSLFAIADLAENSSYKMTAGDISLLKPNYDISFFKSKITLETPVLNIKNINLSTSKLQDEKSNEFWQQKWFIWLIIGLAVIIVAFVISGLLKDLKSSDS